MQELKKSWAECAISAFFCLLRNMDMHADIHKTQWNRGCLGGWLIHIHTHTHTYTHTGILAQSEKLMIKGVIKGTLGLLCVWAKQGVRGSRDPMNIADLCMCTWVCVLCVMFKSAPLSVLLPSLKPSKCKINRNTVNSFPQHRGLICLM